MTVLRGSAITGETFKISHPLLRFDQPYTSHVDVEFLGLTHQVQTRCDRNAYDYATVTEHFNIGRYSGHIIENIDRMQTQHSQKYSAILTSANAVLATTTYTNAASAVELLAALSPQAQDGIFTISSGDEAQVVGEVRVAIPCDIGLLELAPLSKRVLAALPDWQGTRSSTGAEIFAARHSDSTPYLTVVTKTCRTIVIPSVDIDRAVETVQDLNVTWKL